MIQEHPATTDGPATTGWPTLWRRDYVANELVSFTAWLDQTESDQPFEREAARRHVDIRCRNAQRLCTTLAAIAMATASPGHEYRGRAYQLGGVFAAMGDAMCAMDRADGQSCIHSLRVLIQRARCVWAEVEARRQADIETARILERLQP